MDDIDDSQSQSDSIDQNEADISIAIAIIDRQSSIRQTSFEICLAGAGRCGSFAFCNIFRGALEYDLSAGISAFRAEVDNPVGGFDHFQVVFDDQKGISGADKLVECGKKFANIVKMQSRRRFVEYKERIACALHAK